MRTWWVGCIAILCGLVLGAAQAKEPSFSLVFAGDMALDDAPGALIERGGDPLAAFGPLFAQADVRIANRLCCTKTPEAGNLEP